MCVFLRNVYVPSRINLQQKLKTWRFHFLLAGGDVVFVCTPSPLILRPKRFSPSAYLRVCARARAPQLFPVAGWFLAQG